MRGNATDCSTVTGPGRSQRVPPVVVVVVVVVVAVVVVVVVVVVTSTSAQTISLTRVPRCQA